MVRSKELPIFIQGTRRQWLDWSARSLAKQKRWSRDERVRRIYPMIRSLLSSGPKTRGEVTDYLKKAGIPDIELNEYGLAKESCYLGQTIPGPPIGKGSRSGEPTLVLLKAWLPDIDAIRFRRTRH